MTITGVTSTHLAAVACGLLLIVAAPAAQNSNLAITPADPTISVGAIQQFTAPGAVTPSSVSAGGEYTCVTLTDGTARCVGRNQFGQHANGTLNNSAVLDPSDLTNVTRVVAGDEFGCALRGDGTVTCWGLGESGQRGDGTFTQYSPMPGTVSGIVTAVAVSSGYDHACALLGDGTVQCWGGNIYGQLGDGMPTDPSVGPRGSAVPVTARGITTAIGIATGAYHTCALLQDRTLRCWGQNGRGQLGDGTITDASIPVAVTGLTNVAALAGGGAHTCAVLKDGTVYCWGDNEFGQAGDGAGQSSTPMQVVGITEGVAVTTGWRHTCGLMRGGTVLCWGQNQFGQLGNATTANSGTPVPVSGITDAVDITAGWWHHSCALRASGRVRCWGMNEWGQLGDGTTTPSTSPVTMSGTGIAWTSSNPAVAGIDSAGRATALDSGSTTITVTDTSGTTASTTLTVRQRAALSVIRAGAGIGSVTSAPRGINCGPDCAALYDVGTTITLTPTPDSRSTFAGWTGCDSVAGTTCTVTITAATTVTATFELKRFTLTVTKAGLGRDQGSVTSDPAGVSCGADCSKSYTIDTVVTLTATPAVLLTGWSGCDTVSGSTCTVTMRSEKSVTASFVGMPF
jgi:alpha-tubulin suppressor-like RCC1 family protein